MKTPNGDGMWQAGSEAGLRRPRNGQPRLGVTDSNARTLIGLIYDYSGIVLTGDKKSLLASRLQKRLRALGLRSFGEYVDLLQQSPERDAELVAMIDEITTNKTDFFRENQHFEFLVSDILPRLATSDWSLLNFWCAGCSTGEEPYSLAMVLAEYFGTTRNFTILATDLCTQALWTGQQAVYPDELGNAIPPDLRLKYTMQGRGTQAGRFRVVRELRERITFAQVNLIAPAWDIPAAMDVIFCRNVMIYFDLKTRSQVVGAFRRHLKTGGHLFIGHSETLGGIDRRLGFKQVRPTVYVLQK